MASKPVGEELAYPSLPAAITTAALVLLVSTTAGRFLIQRDVVETATRDWLPFFQPFVEILPNWAREAPLILGSVALIVIFTVRFLAERLPSIATYMLALGTICAAAVLIPPLHRPSSAEDWAFVCYVILAAFVGGAPRPYEDQI
jgi:hypothetical protein